MSSIGSPKQWVQSFEPRNWLSMKPFQQEEEERQAETIQNLAIEAQEQANAAAPPAVETLLTTVKARKRVSNVFTSGSGLLGMAPVWAKKLLGQ